MAALLLYVCSAFVVWSVLRPCCVSAQSYDDCPKSCDCLWILTDCSKKGLVSVPTDLAVRSWGTKLELQSNGITSLGPDDFKGLMKLAALDLSNNDITFINGSVFDGLLSLRELKITHNKLTEMPVFPKHLNITDLSLAHNMIHTVSAEALASLPHLRVLHLDHNQIMDLPIRAFPAPSSLTKLFLNNNNIMRLEPGCLDHLTALELLKLNRNQMFELKKDIFSNLTSLKFLELSKNKVSLIEGLTFSGLKNLQVLKLKRNSISALKDGAFWGLKSINNLQLDFNNISNITSSWLFGLSALRHLSLTHNKIGTIQQEGWECCEHNLNRLDLTHNRLETIYSNSFRKLQHLDTLLLDHNQLSRIDDGAFQDLGDLTQLEMNDNAIYWTMEDMSGAFNGLHKLVKLGLKMNHIKSITKEAFTGLKRLRQLHLEDNDITTIQDNSFQPLQNLRELRLNSTNLLCDCHIAWLPEWLKSYGFQSTVVAACSYPEELKGKSIFDIPEDQFRCSDQEVLRPMMVSSPVSQNAYKGENMTLNCTAAITGDAETTIKWKKDNRILQDSLTQTFATSDGEMKRYTSILNLKEMHDDDAGHYQCVVTNGFGSAFSRKAKVNVYVFPVFIKKPIDITVKAGQPAKLQCSATGQPQPVEISWHKDGDDFPAARERRMYVLPKDDQFFIANTGKSDEGVYTCRAENEAGVITANATVTILETPDFIRPMEDEKMTQVGETSVLECMASGSPRPKLHWLKDSQPLVETPRHFFTADNQLLIIVETTWEDAGTYTCEMSNTIGIMRGVTRLKVISNDGQSGPGGGSSVFDDESTTTGIIIIAVVCCVVGTSLVWVIIIYQTRKRHEMYSATPTDETTLPGEVPSTGYSSSDREGSFTQPIGITAYHYQDYQLKETGYEPNGGPYRANCNNNGWPGMRPQAAIFPSDVEEDEQMPVCQHHRATSVSSLPQSGEESDSWEGGGVRETGGVAKDSERGGDSLGPTSRAGLSGSSTLSTFHPGPTNHDRCPSRTIALPEVCGETSDSGGSVGGGGRCGVSKAAATTQTPCPNCQRCDDSDRDRERDSVRQAVRGDSIIARGAVSHRDVIQCEGCRANHHHRLCPEGGSNSDSNAHPRPPPPAIPPRASSFSSLSTTSRPLRPVQQGSGVGGHCCGSGSCNGGQHMRQCQQHRHNGECSNCDRVRSAICPACSHDACLHPVNECQQWVSEAKVRTLPHANAGDTPCCSQCDSGCSPYPHSPSMQHTHTHTHSHPHLYPAGGRDHTHHPPHRHKDAVPVNV